MNEQQAKKLREPFPTDQIGKIPKGGVQLDYVGHAAVTDRLLAVDPGWSWKPLGLTEQGGPFIFKNEGGIQGEPLGLWIELTVCDVTRPGFGGGKNAKECISDALRNAAMRFGVGLDLWSKEDLHPEQGSEGGSEAKSRPASTTASGGSVSRPTSPLPSENASQEQFAEIESLIQDCALARGKTVAEVKAALTTDYGPLSALSVEQAKELVGKLKRWAKAKAAA